MEKLSKSDLKGPDVFVGSLDRVWTKIHDHRVPVFSFVGVLFVTGLGYSTYNIFDSRREQKAQEELFSFESRLETKREGFEKAKAASEEDKTKKDSKDKKTAQKDAKKESEAEKNKPVEPPPVASTGDLEKDLGDVVRGLEGVVEKHPKTRASALAALELSSVLMEYKQPDKAIAQLEKVSKGVGEKEVLFGLIQLKLGDIYESLNQCDKALSSWQKVTANASLTYLHAETLLRTGMCYESLKNTEKALETYRKVSQDFAESRAARVAKKYLRVLQGSNNG